MTPHRLKPTSDRKVRSATSQRNCYGLMPGPNETCPGATQGEGGCWWTKPGRKTKMCYVDGLMNCYKGIRAVLEHNTKILKEANLQEKQEILEAEFERYYRTELKRAKRCIEEPWLLYRLHWSGDFFDIDYVHAACAAMKKFPELKFWVYTRSLWAIPALAQVENLALYISLDCVNIREGLDTLYAWDKYKQYNNVQICYLSPTHNNDFVERWHEARKLTKHGDLWPETPPRMSTCPVDVKKLPLEGGCATCQKCLGLRASLTPIWFCP